MSKFINEWKNLDLLYAQTLKSDDKDEIVVDDPDLRPLNIESKEDKWFVQNVKEVVKPTGEFQKAYDYM